MIVTLPMLKMELGLVNDDQDDMLSRHIETATALVLDYIKADSDTYTDLTGADDLPTVVAAGVILCAKALYDQPEDDPLTPAVQSVLHRYRDPALA